MALDGGDVGGTKDYDLNLVVVPVLIGIKLIWHQLLLVGRTVNPGKAAAKHQQETCSPVMVLWRWQSHHLQILSPI
jgi:hypothetical protein